MESFDVSEESVSESDEIEEFRSRWEDARLTVYDGCTATSETNTGCQRRVCGVGDVDPGKGRGGDFVGGVSVAQEGDVAISCENYMSTLGSRRSMGKNKGRRMEYSRVKAHPDSTIWVSAQESAGTREDEDQESMSNQLGVARCEVAVRRRSERPCLAVSRRRRGGSLRRSDYRGVRCRTWGMR